MTLFNRWKGAILGSGNLQRTAHGNEEETSLEEEVDAVATPETDRDTLLAMARAIEARAPQAGAGQAGSVQSLE